MVASLRFIMFLMSLVIANLQLQMMLAVQPSSAGEGEVEVTLRQNPDDWIMFSKDTAYFR